MAEGSGLFGLDTESPDLAPDYLGKMVGLAFKDQPALPVTGPAAVGGPSAPIGPGGGVGGGGGTTRLAGGEAAPGSNLVKNLLSQGRSLAEIAKQIFGGGDLGTRGETGGVSLSDQVRSSGPGAAGATGALPPAELQMLRDILAPDNLATLQQTFSPAEIEGMQSILAGGGAGAEVGAEVAGEAAGAGGASLAGVALYPFTKSLMDWIMGVAPPSGKMHETGTIRSDFGKAWPTLAGSEETLGRFADLAGKSPEEQAAILQGIAQEGGLQLAQIPAVSQFTSTEGGRHSGTTGEMLSSFMGSQGKVSPVDVRGIEGATPILYMDAALNSIVAHDLMARRGISGPDDPTGTTYRNMAAEDPMGLLNLLSQEAGVDLKNPAAAGETDPRTGQPSEGGWRPDIMAEDIAAIQTPGQTIPGITKLFSRLNPDFAKSPLGQRLAAFQGSGLYGAPGGPGAVEAPPAEVTPDPSPQPGSPGLGGGASQALEVLFGGGG